MILRSHSAPFQDAYTYEESEEEELSQERPPRHQPQGYSSSSDHEEPPKKKKKRRFQLQRSPGILTDSSNNRTFSQGYRASRTNQKNQFLEESTMAPADSTRRQKGKKTRKKVQGAKRKSSREAARESDDDDTTLVSFVPNTQELDAQIKRLMDENKRLKRQNKVQSGKSGGYVMNTAIASDVSTIMKQNLWDVIKFCGSEDQLRKVSRKVFMAQGSYPALLASKSKEKIEDEMEIFFKTYGGHIAKVLNDKRSSVQTCIAKMWKLQLNNAKQHCPTSSKQVFDIVMRKKGMCEPIIEEVPQKDDDGKIILDEDGNKVSFPEVQNSEELAMFDWWITVVLRQATCFGSWGDSDFKYQCPSSATHAHRKRAAVTASCEAFACLTFENNMDRWLWMNAEEKAGRIPNRSHPKYQPKYTGLNVGQQKFGGWSNDGILRFVELQNLVKKNRAENGEDIQRYEQDALERIQVAYGVSTTSKSSKKKKKKQKPQQDIPEVPFSDDESEPDE